MLETQFILDYLSESGGSVKEHQLLSLIEEKHPEFFSSLGGSPSLFKQHFFLFNQLYRLNNQLIKHNLHLIISALEIRLCPVGYSGTEIGQVDALKDFYLDESNLDLSDDELNKMMCLFWKKYMALDKKAEAIKTLELDNVQNLNRKKLKKKFNQLAKKYHPDKGGDETEFIKVKTAYDDLKLLIIT